MDLLKTLLEVASGASDAAARQQAVRAALAEAGTPNLAELEQAAQAAFAELNNPDGGFDDDVVERMAVLVDVVDAVRAEASDQVSARAAELAERMGKRAEPKPAEEPAEAPAEEPAEEPAEAPGQPNPLSPPPANGDVVEQPQSEQVETREVAVVAAGRKNTVPLGALPKNLPAPKSVSIALTAAADIPGVPMGTMLDGIDGLTKATVARMQSLSRAGKDASAGIAVIETTQSDERLIASRPDDYEVIEYACDEKRLPGGSLVAAAGWCAPPEQIYDQFCPVAVVDGLVSLPSITAKRGGITWPTTPDFSQIYSGTGFYMPIEEMEKPETGTGARRDKPCYLIQCTGTQSAVLDAYGLCVQVPILTERAYPELVSHTTQQILAAHAHKMNAVKLRKMEALAQAVTVTAPAAGTDAPYGPGATATLLGLIELQVEYLRSHYRLGVNATMEMVIPTWVRGILRSDLAKRMGGDLEMITITDAQLDQFLRSRGVNTQFVLDWQDAFAGPDSTGATDSWLPTYDGAAWGGATPPLVWPSTVKMLIYPAGSYFALTNDIITIDGLYDSSLLQRNLHLALFTEEALEVALRGCYKPLALSVPLCANGATGQSLAVACPSA